MSRCPEAAYGEHGAPNYRGRCPYCDTHLTTPTRLPAKRQTPEFDFEEVTDDVTMEPVSAFEREDVYRAQQRTRWLQR